MADKMTITDLYKMVDRELSTDGLQELDADAYSTVAGLIGDLRAQEYDGLEAQIKGRLVEMAGDLARILVRVRLAKYDPERDFTNLLDEEKYIADSNEDGRGRTDMIVAALLNGKSKLLESISDDYKARKVPVRFLDDVERFIGADVDEYGPFKAEDIATIPTDNAYALVSQNKAARVRLD